MQPRGNTKDRRGAPFLGSALNRACALVLVGMNGPLGRHSVWWKKEERDARGGDVKGCLGTGGVGGGVWNFCWAGSGLGQLGSDASLG